MGFKRDEAWISLWGVFASAGGCRNWIQHIATDSYPAPFFLPLVFLSFFCNSTLGPSSILTAACVLSLPLHLSRLQHIKYLSIMCLSIMFTSASQFPFLVLNFTFFQSHWMYQEGLCAWECGRPQRPRHQAPWSNHKLPHMRIWHCILVLYSCSSSLGLSITSPVSLSLLIFIRYS